MGSEMCIRDRFFFFGFSFSVQFCFRLRFHVRFCFRFRFRSCFRFVFVVVLFLKGSFLFSFLVFRFCCLFRVVLTIVFWHLSTRRIIKITLTDIRPT